MSKYRRIFTSTVANERAWRIKGYEFKGEYSTRLCMVVEENGTLHHPEFVEEIKDNETSLG